MREIAINTNTTGLQPEKGHRVIEIACVEINDGTITGHTYHQYIKPEREIDEAAIDVHGITPELLADKPVFSEIADKLIEFIGNANIIGHNVSFDIGFLNAEMDKIAKKPLNEGREIIDTLKLSRDKYSGQKNNIDAVSERLNINDTILKGASLYAHLAAEIYLKI